MLNNNYKNEAMKIMEQLKKAEETRIAMIKEAQETLVVLGAESTSNTIVENVININKGKIIAVETTVEVPVEKTIYVDKTVEKIIDNTDYTTIEELRNRNNELEVQLTNALNKIAELEKAAITVEPKIVEPAIDTTITVGPLTIEEIIVEETVETNDEDIKPKLFVGGKDDNYAYPTREEIIAHVYYVYNIPKELRGHDIVKKAIDEFTKHLYSPVSNDTRMMAAKMKDCIVGLGTLGKLAMLKRQNGYDRGYKIEEQIEDDKTKCKEIELLKDTNEDGEYVYGVQGKIIINRRTYAFKYTNSHCYPCVFGCMDMNVIEEAKRYLKENFDIAFSFDNKYVSKEEENAMNTAYDFTNNIVIYKVNDMTFKGYIDSYAFVWNTEEEIPCGITAIKALTNKYRKMNSSWGNGFVARAQMIKDMCKKHFPECFESTKEEVKQIVTNTTNDEIDPDDLLE